MRCNGKSSAPELYHTSMLLVPNAHNSRKLDSTATKLSGDPSALAKSRPSMLVPSSKSVIHNFWLFGSLNMKYPSR